MLPCFLAVLLLGLPANQITLSLAEVQSELGAAAASKEAQPKPALKARAPVPVQQSKEAPAKGAPAHAPATLAATRAEVLVVVSDHGSGTSTFDQTLNEHPCMFNVGEPFGPGEMLWSSSEVPGCTSKAFSDAIFDAKSGTLTHTENPKLERAIETARMKLPGKKPIAIDTRPLYHNLQDDLADFFVRVRDLVCKGVPEDVCPASHCTISVKMFPSYVFGDTKGQQTKDDAPGPCIEAQNAQAMTAWKAALASFDKNPKIAALQLRRNEVDRQFSFFHRFTGVGTQFDCSIPRPPFAFATWAKSHTDLQMQSEDCWAEPDTCLTKALRLVGLKPLGDDAAKDLTKSNEKNKFSLSAHSKSCATDALGIFKKLPHADVQMIAHAPQSDGTAAAPDESQGGEVMRRVAELLIT